jgi:hypothetical protein
VAIGEAGSITTNSPGENDLIRVDFDQPIENAIIGLSSTSIGGDPFTLRVVNVDANGFDFIIEEWEYLDGPHPATETINWIAIEEGVHTLPDGRVIEAGTTTTSGRNTAVAFDNAFDSAPVVLTSVMSNNDTTTVDSDPLNISGSGFTVRLQEEEAEANNHGSETVGYIAIEPGGTAESGTAGVPGSVNHNTGTLSLGDSFTDPVVIVKTQTINGGNPGTLRIDGQTGSTVDVFFEEEQSGDAETNHIQEDVGVVAFEDGIIPCFTPGALIETVRGPVPVETLRPGDLVLTEDHGPQPLRWLCRTRLGSERLARQPHLAPILIRAGALGPDLPARDLTVSPQHRMLITGWRAELLFGAAEVLVPALSLVNDRTILREQTAGEVSYLHLLFDRHELVTANGALSESMHAGQLDKSALRPCARAELLQLFPDLAALPGSFGPTARMSLRAREARLLAA